MCVVGEHVGTARLLGTLLGGQRKGRERSRKEMSKGILVFLARRA